MHFKIRTPGGEMTGLAAVAIIAGLWLAILHIREPFALVGLIFVTCGVDLWFKQQWARWATIGVMVLIAAGYAATKLLAGTFGRKYVLLVCGSLYGAWSVWNGFRPARTVKAGAEAN